MERMKARTDLKNAKYLPKAQSMDADFSALIVDSCFRAGFVILRSVWLARGGQGLTAREMSVLV